MKPRNFPARKEARRQRATGAHNAEAIAAARAVRTKKNRGGLRPAPVKEPKP